MPSVLETLERYYDAWPAEPPARPNAMRTRPAATRSGRTCARLADGRSVMVAAYDATHPEHPPRGWQPLRSW